MHQMFLRIYPGVLSEVKQIYINHYAGWLWHFSLVKKQNDIHSETRVVSEMTPYIPDVVHDV